MYSVVVKNYSDSGIVPRVVKHVNNYEAFIKYIEENAGILEMEKLCYEERLNKNFVYERLNINLNELHDTTYSSGKYILEDLAKRKTYLVEKHVNTNQGYILTTTSVKIVKLIKFYLIQDLTLSKSLLHEYSLNDLIDSGNILITGQPGSGKSILIGNILDKYSNDIINKTLIVCKKRDYTFYKRSYQDASVITKLNNELLGDYMTTQTIFVFDDYKFQTMDIKQADMLLQLSRSAISNNKLVIYSCLSSGYFKKISPIDLDAEIYLRQANSDNNKLIEMVNDMEIHNCIIISNKDRRIGYHNIKYIC